MTGQGRRRQDDGRRRARAWSPRGAGKRTIVAEVARRDDVHRALAGSEGGCDESAVGDRLFALSIDPQRALEEYLATSSRAPLADLLAGSRAVRATSPPRRRACASC